MTRQKKGSAPAKGHSLKSTSSVKILNTPSLSKAILYGVKTNRVKPDFSAGHSTLRKHYRSSEPEFEALANNQLSNK